MNKIDEILRELDSGLGSLETEDQSIKKVEQSIVITKKSLQALRKYVTTHDFKNKSDEIYFFKNIKPKVYSKLIYFIKLFTIESKRPRGSNKSQVKYLNSQIDRLQSYFHDNLHFYHYYRRDATIFDEQYFLRGKIDLRLYPDSFHFLVDEQFSTSHDSAVATILAYDLLIVHIKQEIDKLENIKKIPKFEGLQEKAKLTWTAHKIYLIELIYALHSTDVINNGTVDIKDIAYFVESIFKIDLGDYYRAFLEIRMRKNTRTKFLDILKQNLIQRMDVTDNKI